MKYLIIILSGGALGALIFIANKFNLFSWISKLFRGNNNNSSKLLEQLANGIKRLSKGLHRAKENTTNARQLAERAEQNNNKLKEQADRSRGIIDRNLERGERVNDIIDSVENRNKNPNKRP